MTISIAWLPLVFAGGFCCGVLILLIVDGYLSQQDASHAQYWKKRYIQLERKVIEGIEKGKIVNKQG